MTIGPEPIRRMVWRSVRFGTSAFRSLDQVDEAPEEITRVVRTGRRLRMILDGEERLLGVREPLDRLVVQIEVGERRLAFQRVDVDREAVVLRGDLDLAGGGVHHGMIRPMMAELELVRAA